MEASSEAWNALLDRLSACITPLEQAAVRQAAVDRGSPSHLRQLHDHVAGLLVKHRLATWAQLYASFPNHHTLAAEGREESSRAEVAEDVAPSSRGQGGKGAAAALAGHNPDMQDPSKLHSHRSASPSGLKRKAAGSLDDADRPAEGGMSQSGGGLPQEELEDDMRSASLGSPQSRAGKKRKGITLADYPQVVSWWHPTKNGDMLPKDYSHASSKRVWMQCPGCPDCGEIHEWDATCRHLTRADRALICAPCTIAGRILCSCRSIAGDEELLAEWHADNPSPGTVSLNSHEKFKWRCAEAACGHVWEAQPANRSKVRGSGCPECGRKARNHTQHPSVAVGRPELVAEWDKKKNTLLPTEVSCGSSKKVWWRCKVCRRSWNAPVQQRALKDHGCSRCWYRSRSIAVGTSVANQQQGKQASQ